jgi:PAS domain S-box-containing protein
MRRRTDKLTQPAESIDSAHDGPLRRRAEEKARNMPKDPGAGSPPDSRRLLHELQVHRIELEMKNEELRRTQEELEASRTRLLDCIADAFFSLDEQWRFVCVNPAAERAQFGRPAGELLGKAIWDVFPSLVGTRAHQHYLDAVKKRSHEHYETQSPLNGLWYEVFIFPRTGGLDV